MYKVYTYTLNLPSSKWVAHYNTDSFFCFF